MINQERYINTYKYLTWTVCVNCEHLCLSAQHSDADSYVMCSADLCKYVNNTKTCINKYIEL